MNTKLITMLAVATLLLGGCAMAPRHGNPDAGGTPAPGSSAPSPERPVNPYSDGGFHDLGPNYPPTGR